MHLIKTFGRGMSSLSDSLKPTKELTATSFDLSFRASLGDFEHMTDGIKNAIKHVTDDDETEQRQSNKQDGK